MIRGLYTSGWGMLTLQKKMDVVANNMANVSTAGFKRDVLSLEAFPDILTQRIADRTDPAGTRPVGSMSLFNNLGTVRTNFTQGFLEDSGKLTDMSLDADSQAFFVVGVAQADGTVSELLTRDGGFQLTAEGMLVTRNGNPVLGENGSITIPNTEFTVRGDGTVEADNIVIDRLQIRSIANTESLRKVGGNLLNVTEETEDRAFQGRVMQGRIEQSNVEAVREMVEMISVLRAYEANQRMIQQQDGTLEKAVNEIGRLG